MNKIFQGSAPVFYVRDLMKSLKYYCDVLGFERPRLWGDPPSFAMPKRENMIIMLSVEKDHTKIQPKEHIWDQYYWVNNARALYNEFVEKGAFISQDLVFKEEYGNMEFIVRDPDGYHLAFGQGVGEDHFFEHHPEEKTGFTKLLHLSPVLASSDVSRDVEWYENRLGFRNVFDSTKYHDGPMDYAVVGRQDLYLHMQFQYPKDMTSTDVRIQVVHIDPLFEEYLQKGILKEDSMRRGTAWGTNEFGLFDLSRNRITFFEDV